MLQCESLAMTNFQRVYEQHVDAVYRICYSFMKNKADAEDAVQETFLKLLQNKQTFENDAHERAWLIVTASNICKNHLRSWTRQKREELETFEEIPDKVRNESENPVLEAVLKLPDKYKTVIYLFYFEEYSCGDIAAALDKKESTIRSLLKRGRAILQKALGGEADES